VTEQGERPTGSVLRQADALLSAARTVVADHAELRADVRSALAPLRDELVRRELNGIPVSRLKDVTEGRLQLSALERAGYSTVRKVLEAGEYTLLQLPGSTTSSQACCPTSGTATPSPALRPSARPSPPPICAATSRTY
jgi:hypothetical protein